MMFLIGLAAYSNLLLILTILYITPVCTVYYIHDVHVLTLFRGQQPYSPLAILQHVDPD